VRSGGYRGASRLKSRNTQRFLADRPDSP
jgi:hypothetical protein